MRILIEASEAYRNHAGIGRFSREFLRHLPTNLEVAFSPADFETQTYVPGRRTFGMRLHHFGTHLWQTQLAGYMAARAFHPDVYHSLSFFAPVALRNVPVVTTLFDLAYFDLPQQTDRFWGLYGRTTMQAFARMSAAVITTSDTMRAAIMARFRLPPEQIHRVYGGVSAQFTTDIAPTTLDEVRTRYQLEERFVLYSGAWHGNKNLPLLLQAFQPIRDAVLVLTGKPHSAQEQHIEQMAKELEVRARFIGYVPEDDLAALYQLAEFVVLPSSYEGFGLPMLEAMASGAAVIASDIPVLVEIACGAALHFRVNSRDELFERIRYWLDHPSERDFWRQRAREHASNFSWVETANQIAAIWQSVV